MSGRPEIAALGAGLVIESGPSTPVVAGRNAFENDSESQQNTSREIWRGKKGRSVQSACCIWRSEQTPGAERNERGSDMADRGRKSYDCIDQQFSPWSPCFRLLALLSCVAVHAIGPRRPRLVAGVATGCMWSHHRTDPGCKNHRGPQGHPKADRVAMAWIYTATGIPISLLFCARHAL